MDLGNIDDVVHIIPARGGSYGELTAVGNA